ncbi:MAG: hypothetical protein MJY97_01230 [Bacteroidales bacterium]|nr:hypothetical protein [Bacteroidales bacterium]
MEREITRRNGNGKLDKLCRHLESLGCTYMVYHAEEIESDSEDTLRVSIVNDHGKGTLDVDVDHGYVMHFDDWHAHYEYADTDEQNYETLIEDLDAILANRRGVGIIRKGNGDWFGSRLVDDKDIENDQLGVFWFVLGEQYHRNELVKSDGRIVYSYWNPYKDFSFALDVDRLRAMDNRVNS